MAVEFIGMIGTRSASELEGASAALTGEQVAESLVATAGQKSELTFPNLNPALAINLK